jgi:hypothetical protein
MQACELHSVMDADDVEDDVSETESYYSYSDDSNDSSVGWSDINLEHHEEYWNELGHGILSHPAPLQVQCLLSIV